MSPQDHHFDFRFESPEHYFFSFFFLCVILYFVIPSEPNPHFHNPPQQHADRESSPFVSPRIVSPPSKDDQENPPSYTVIGPSSHQSPPQVDPQRHVSWGPSPIGRPQMPDHSAIIANWELSKQRADARARSRYVKIFHVVGNTH
jgi:hypothetical protein